MQTFAAAYLIVWLGVVGFMARMAMRQRHLERTVATLTTKMAVSEQDATSNREKTSHSKAA